MIFGKHINKYYISGMWRIILGLASLLLVDYLQLIIPELYRMLINGINSGEVEVNGAMQTFNQDFLLDSICKPVFFIVIAMAVGRFLWRFTLNGLAVNVETDLRKRMFDHSKNLSQQYYQVNKVGDLMSLFTNDIETIHESFCDGILFFFDALILGILAFYKMWNMSVRMTLLAMIPMGALMFLSLYMSKLLTKRWDARQEAFSKLSDFSQETFTGLAVIKAFVKELVELKVFSKLNKENEDVNVNYTKASMGLDMLITFFCESTVCVILGVGGYFVYNKSFTAGQLVEYIGYFMTIVWPVLAIAFLIEMHSRGVASYKRIAELLEADIDVKDAEGVSELTNPKGEIEFRNLSFTYPDGDREILHNVSFKINPGESVGIIGKTGSGKSTLADLMLRTYNVPNGTLFFDGCDVNTLSIASLRAACAYCPQDNFLFSDTIANNIAFAFDENDDESIQVAASLSGVHKDIQEFKDQYSTVLGERGVTVSGGQKQRISIARALVKDAPVLILDDSVSAVDTDTERTILKNLRETRVGKTTILISHRISTIEGMDKIILIEEGSIIAAGSHEELIRNSDSYAKMVELQKLEDEVNDKKMTGGDR